MMRPIKSHLIRERITYTGSQLRSHWIMETAGILGDAIVAFQGPADVPVENLVDLVDVRQNAPIRGNLMLHFIAEHFGISLKEGGLRQRLLMAIVGEELRKYPKASDVIRRGDDLFDGTKKLSVSIAAPSPVSCCIHTGLNIDCTNTPVPTVGLADYNIDAMRFATGVMNQYIKEHSQMEVACSKVRSVP